jgi:putative PEP-CTERM system histidine kinase
MAEMASVGVIAYAAATAAFVFLTGLLLTVWRGRTAGRVLLVAAACSTVWAALHAYDASSLGPLPDVLLEIAELVRAAAWYACILGLLGDPAAEERNGYGVRRTMKIVAVGLPAMLFLMLVVLASIPQVPGRQYAADVFRVGHLLLAVFGLVLVEQLFRNANVEWRWGIKFLCFGIGGLFVFDFYLFADALLVKQIDLDLWHARGVVNTLAVPLIVMSGVRDPLWTGKVAMSRQVVFHSAALLAAGVYLMLMAAVGYYIRAYGGQWGGALQITFLFGAAVILGILALSGQARARLKVFVGKHFLQSKYDYRREWLRFADTLSETGQEEDIPARVVKTIAKIVESPSGMMWIKPDSEADFVPVVMWNMTAPPGAKTPQNESMLEFLATRQWIIDLDEYGRAPGRYEDLELPKWLQALTNARLVLPLMHHSDLEGFVVLGQPRADITLNWEDHDLLKTVGRQAASYLRLIKTSDALSEARQFEAFNRLSAYVVHDLKNLVAQLSLVVTNAKKHMHKPEFVTDAIQTVDNAVGKMNRMLVELRKEHVSSGSDQVIDMAQVVTQVVKERTTMAPVPSTNVLAGEVLTMADPDRLAAVIGHIIQNAQEATADDGTVEVSLHGNKEWAVLEVEDNGCGMDEQFIRSRLFRPFDTTKGNAGMGVGAYEAREFARARGGDVEISSEPEKGTRFVLRLPRHYRTGKTDDAALLRAMP